jgi:quinoprotein glucose dehydrogenase
MRHRTLFALAAGFIVGLHIIHAQTQKPAATQTAAKSHTTWSDYAGGSDASQYSALAQINRSNVNQLEIAWKYPTGDTGGYLFDPLVVDNVMFVQAKGGSIVALDAATGKEL